MALNNKTSLKAFFVKGAQPTQAQFASLVDSQINLIEGGTSGVQSMSGSIQIQQNITASNISASGTIFANNFQSAGGDVGGVTFVDSVSLTGDMTASGNMMISGNVTLGDECSDQITINGTVTASCDISSSANLTVGGNTKLFGDSAVIAPNKLYFGNSEVLTNASGMHIYSEGVATDENQIILAKTNDLRILNQAHGKSIEFNTEDASGAAHKPLILTGGHITASGAISASGALTIGGTTRLEGDTTLTSPNKLYLDGPNGMHIYSEGISTNEDQIILVKTNDLRILNQAHGKSIEFGTEDASGAAKTPLILTGGHITASGVISGSTNIITSDLTVTDDLSITDDLLLTSDSSIISMGAGADVTITHDGTTGVTIAATPITIDSAGALNLFGTSINIGTDTDVAIDIDSSTLDIDASGAITIDGVGLSIDSTGVAANITSTTDGNAEDFTISLAGATDSSLILSSTGTGADALQITTTAGGIDISATGNAAGEDIDISSAASINLTATEDAANAIYLRANGGTSETIKIHSDQGTGAGSIELTSDAGGVDINAGDDITIDAGDNITLTAADNFDVNTSTADGKVTLFSAHTAGAAFHIDANANVGSILDIDAGILDIDSDGATTIDAASTITIAGATGATFGDDTEALAYDGSGNLDLDAVALDVDTSGAINIAAAGAASDIFISTAHTAGVAFHLDANANADSEVQIDAGILDIDVTGLASIDSTGISFSGAVTSSIISASGNILTSGDVTAVGTIQAEQLTSTDDISATGDVTGENLIVKSEILHHGNINTKVIFDTDTIRFDVGGEQLLKLVEDDSQDKIIFGDGGDVDFEFSGTGAFKFITDATDHPIQQHDGTEVARIHDGGSTQASGMTAISPGFGFKRPVHKITADSGDATVALSEDDSGAIIHLDADTNNIIVNLPVVDSLAKVGTEFTFVVSTAVNGSKTIVINTSGTDGNDNFLLHNHSKNAFDHAGDTITIPASAPIGTVIRVTCLSSGASNAAELWLAEGFTDNIAVTNA